MKQIMFIITSCLLIGVENIQAQNIRLGNYDLEAVSASVSKEILMNHVVIKVIKDSSVKEFDEPTFARLKNIDFKNGIIEVRVLSRLLPNAPELARGFIGVAFRINDSNNQYESIYVRPLNARVNDQVRRNHSIQYYSYPNYKFDTLRKIAPEKYESYSDMEMNKWIDLRIEVEGIQAKLFINKNEQPSLVVNDLKHGANVSGAIALWVEVGTEGYFSNLKITKRD